MVDKTNFVAKADDLYAQAEKKLKGNIHVTNKLLTRRLPEKHDVFQDRPHGGSARVVLAGSQLL